MFVLCFLGGVWRIFRCVLVLLGGVLVAFRLCFGGFDLFFH